jgi:hypothetical protein
MILIFQNGQMRSDRAARFFGVEEVERALNSPTSMSEIRKSAIANRHAASSIIKKKGHSFDLPFFTLDLLFFHKSLIYLFINHLKQNLCDALVIVTGYLVSLFYVSKT